ncbi:trigger factor [Spiroplasma endosymbiont of Labia minor]|uniref:trigger factor n=1 Tax=Spiroplasma endosymbiont of Labia minor TaxID=3066305 RepID=UPI0030CC4E17
MKFKEEKLVKLGQGKWIVSIVGEEWTKFYNRGKAQAISNLEIKGFRKGKVPKELQEKSLSSTKILTNAYAAAVESAWNFAKEQKHGIEPWSSPASMPKKLSESEMEVEFVFDLRPEIKIGNYKDITGPKKEKLTASAQEINDEIKQYQKRFAMEKTKDDKDALIEKGNVVVFDFEGFKDDKPFNGGKGENYLLEIGSNQFIPGFEDGMIGMKLGKNKLNISFPEDYQVKELAGMPTVFKLDIKEIKERTLPELDDTLMKDLNIKSVSTVADLKKYVKKLIEDKKSTELKNIFVNQVIDEIIKNSTIEIPKGAIDRETANMRQDFENQVIAQKLTIKDYKKKTGLTDEDINKEIFGDAKRRLESYLITDEVRKQEKLEATDDEIKTKYDELSKQFGMDVEQITELLPHEKIAQEIISNKIINFLYENNG